ncbi:hypothetical protein ACFL2Y_03110 [Candidatus Omnitrophota bacterium]
MVLKGIILAFFCSCISIISHLFINLFRKGRRVDEPVINELKRHAKLLFFIWTFFFFIYALIFFQTPYKFKVLIEELVSITKTFGFAYGLFIYLSLSLIYLCVYYFVDRSVSATILEIIDNAAKKKLSIDEIKKVYPPEKKYQMELMGMLQGGFLIKDSDYFKNSFKGRLYAKAARLTKKLLKLGSGG